MWVCRVASTKAPFGRRQRIKRGVRWGVIGVRNSLAEDFQFHCLDMEWGPLLALVFSAYFACSCLFAASFYYISVRHSVGFWRFMGSFVCELVKYVIVGNSITPGLVTMMIITRFQSEDLICVSTTL